MNRFTAILVAFGISLGSASLAQTPPEGLTFDTVLPPRGEGADRYKAAVGRSAQSDATYATEVHGGVLTADSRAPRRLEPEEHRRVTPLLEGNWALVFVIGLLVGLMFLWLRFGGGGLLASGPKQAKARTKAPEAWDLSHAEDQLSGEALLQSIATMGDRRAATVRLLRHALIQAAELSQIHFARSDTERLALNRLPQDLTTKFHLTDLLRRAELAGYGGRAVSDAEFAASFDKTRGLFLMRGALDA